MKTNLELCSTWSYTNNICLQKYWKIKHEKTYI